MKIFRSPQAYFGFLVFFGTVAAGCSPRGEQPQEASQLSQQTRQMTATDPQSEVAEREEGAPSEAIEIVSASLGPNPLGISESDLLEKSNPKGEGSFVYVAQTRFSGVERLILWMVIDGAAYPVNGTTKGVSPSLSWPREAPQEVWSRTGISPYMATDAIEIVFGPQ